MKPLKRMVWSGRIQSLIPPARLSLSLVLTAVLGLSGDAISATNIVTSLADSGAGSLRQTIAQSASGDSIAFAVTGTISLTSGELVIAKDVALNGPGPSALAVSGNSSSRIFNINTNVTFSILCLTVRDGRARYGSNGAVGESGGGIYNAGTLFLSNCVITGNSAGDGAFGTSGSYGGRGASGGSGGGIWSGPAISLINCTIKNNHAGQGGQGGYGQFWAGDGGPGGGGGGLFVSGDSTMTGCTIVSNTAGVGGKGGTSNGSPGAGAAGGGGGGIYGGGNLVLTNCTIAANSGGQGGRDGDMISGPPSGLGGPGGNGGGIYSSNTNQTIVACTISGNAAGLSGAAYRPGAVDGQGGGVYSVNPGGPMPLNAIVALNTGPSPDVCGSFNSLGYNLIGVTNGSSGFTAGGDLVGSSGSPFDPQISPLTDHGGPTMTMALLPSSPAIEAGTTIGVPVTDQRGVARPQGAAADIGAYEFEFTPQIISARLQPPSAFWLRSCGLPNQIYTLQASTNLRDWLDVTNFCTGANGLGEVTCPVAGNSSGHFFRTKWPAPP